MTIYNSETGLEVTELDQMMSHDDLIDELYPMVTIGIYEWLPSAVLFNVDPIAYKVSLIEHVDQMVESGVWFESDDMNCRYFGEQLCGTDRCVCYSR
jgi:hypothetical protein